MAERAEEGMDNENVCGAENSCSPSPKLPVVDAATLDERDEGMQKYVTGIDAVSERKSEELLPSLSQKDETKNSIEQEDGFPPPVDLTSAPRSPFDDKEACAPIQDASGKDELIDSKRAAEHVSVNMAPGLEENRQGEAPIEIEQEQGKKTSAEIECVENVEPSIEVQSSASNLLESKREQHLEQTNLDNMAEPEGGAGDNSGPREYSVNKLLEKLVNNAPGISIMLTESQEASDVQQQGAPELVEKDKVVFEENPGQSEEQIQDHSASKELNEQEDIETTGGNHRWAASAPDEALLIKEPCFSTPAMEALIDFDNKEPSCGLGGFETVEGPEQHMGGQETYEESAKGSGRQYAFDGISNQVEVANDAQERTGNNAFGEDDSPKGAPESAMEVIISSGQELGLVTIPAAEQDVEGALGNEPPLVLEHKTEKPPIDEVRIKEFCVESGPGIEEGQALEQEPLEQNLDTASSSPDLGMAADMSEEGDEALLLKSDEVTTSTGIDEGEVAAASEVEDIDTTNKKLEENNPEIGPALQTLNGKEALNSPCNKESDEKFEKHLETEGLITGQAKSCVHIDNEAFPSEGETQAKSDAVNGQLDEDDANKTVQEGQVSVIITPWGDTSMEEGRLTEKCDELSSQSEPASKKEHEAQSVGNRITVTQLESTADDISNGLLEPSITAEAPSKNHLSDSLQGQVLENGDSPQRQPSRENRGEVEGSYVGHSTAPVLDLGKAINGITGGEASAEQGPVYHGMTAEDNKQSSSEPVIYNNSASEVEPSEERVGGTQAAEAKCRDINAVKGKEVMGVTKGVPSHRDAISTSDSLALKDEFLRPTKGDTEKESEANVDTDSTANICIADKKNAQVFHDERNREANLSIVVSEQRDAGVVMASDQVEQNGAECRNGRVTLARRTNWWGCCGMLDLLLRTDEE